MTGSEIRHRLRTGALLVEHPGAGAAERQGLPVTCSLRAVLRGDTPLVPSRLERRFLVLLRQAGLPRPEANRPAGGHCVDCRWPQHRLTVELDSYRYHHFRHAWEQDRRREGQARARGDEFRRCTWADVCEDPQRPRASARLHLPREVVRGDPQARVEVEPMGVLALGS